MSIPNFFIKRSKNDCKARLSAWLPLLSYCCWATVAELPLHSSQVNETRARLGNLLSYTFHQCEIVRRITAALRVAPLLWCVLRKPSVLTANITENKESPIDCLLRGDLDAHDDPKTPSWCTLASKLCFGLIFDALGWIWGSMFDIFGWIWKPLEFNFGWFWGV